jgi:Zn-dependent peptidase ImmA (M78 family)
MDRDQRAVITQDGNRKDTREQRANAFSAAFLMPADGVRDVLYAMGKGQGSRREEAVLDATTEDQGIKGELRSPPHSQTVTAADAALLAEHFGVSYPAAVWRLLGVGAINAAEKDSLMKQTPAANRYTRMIRDACPEQAAASPAKADLRWQIVPLAIEAWRRKEISGGRLAEIARRLGMDPDEVVDLARAMGDG